MNSRPLVCNRPVFKPVYRAGVIALLMIFTHAVAATGPIDNHGLDSSGEPQQTSFWIEDPHTGKSLKAHTHAPDMSLWNAKRVKDYEDSLMVNAEPPIGVITIGDLNIQIPIYNGAEDLNLNRGVGRIRGMARINETGNLGIAGHRDGVFRSLKDIEKGDAIEVLSIDGVEKYEVSSITIVEKNDISVLAPTPDQTLTLVTCYPFYHIGHAPKRYIVKARAID